MCVSGISSGSGSLDININQAFTKKEEPMEELKITKEKVLEAAETCKHGKEVLKALFPEVFEEGLRVGQIYEFNKTKNKFIITINDYFYNAIYISGKQKGKTLVANCNSLELLKEKLNKIYVSSYTLLEY